MSNSRVSINGLSLEDIVKMHPNIARDYFFSMPTDLPKNPIIIHNGKKIDGVNVIYRNFFEQK